MPNSQKYQRNFHNFLNRETSLLEFNLRVLEEAKNDHNPLLERINFLGISSSNMDEFFMVRIAGIKDQVKNNVNVISQDGLSPVDQLANINQRSRALMQAQQACWGEFKELLKQNKIEIVNHESLGKTDKKWLEEYFHENIFPVLTPLAIDPAHPFPFIPNLGIAILCHLQKGKKQQLEAIITIPPKLKRFIALPNGKYILIEDVITLFWKKIFPDAKMIATGITRITRDSDVEISDDAEDLMKYLEHAVKQKRKGEVIRLEANAEMPRYLLEFVAKNLEVVSDDIFSADEMVGMASVKELIRINRPELKFKPFIPRFPERVTDYNNDCFAAIKAKDILVHHPYESFDVVVKFLEQAANDPQVVAIKQTLYRTSNDSPIVKALIQAAEAGKSVTALVELKARFDEEANIRWAKDMEKAGVHVVFGFMKLKTHAKVSLVVRNEGGSLRSYVHFGTGNYHPITAKIYSDLSLFTCDTILCRDAAYLFNYLTGYSPPDNFEKLVIAPLHLRNKLIGLINMEIDFAKKGLPANMWIKVNALVDEELIEHLYRASQAGVSIDLVVRGICCLKPGVKDLSENIRVKSLIGRFLEHSRIYCFGNGDYLPSANAKVYISSADWMARNLDRRIETMVPIENPTVHEQILGQIMLASLKDERQSWSLNEDGSYKRVIKDSTAFSAHDYFMNNPSLSGRGTALSR